MTAVALAVVLGGCEAAARWFPCVVASLRAAGEYPLTLTLDAIVNTTTATLSSTVTIQVDRLMIESRRTRVTDVLTHSGYSNFVAALRALPAVGAIELQGRRVEVRYAHEQTNAAGRRLVLIADRPLVFLSGDPARSRAGFELTIVDLRFDPQGAITGRMMGAARVKPSPDGPQVDEFATAPVRLALRVDRP